jgi:hypothetical protein
VEVEPDAIITGQQRGDAQVIRAQIKPGHRGTIMQEQDRIAISFPRGRGDGVLRHILDPEIAANHLDLGIAALWPAQDRRRCGARRYVRRNSPKMRHSGLKTAPYRHPSRDRLMGHRAAVIRLSLM